MPEPALIAKPRRRNHDEAVLQVADRLGIFVPETLGDVVCRPPCRRPVHRRDLDRHQAASTLSAQTVIDRNSAGPNVVTIATSSASRPRPISTRPTRLALLRGSNVHQRSPNQTSITSERQYRLGRV